MSKTSFIIVTCIWFGMFSVLILAHLLTWDTNNTELPNNIIRMIKRIRIPM